ncbi:ribbon-helix-helix protein, CopG family [Novosphingobium gossypii]|uniref:ribbon-helix-helix protein, CopG family n=1 Tax=Novosphingobium gossypii TaxID=1604774 RepID=UPI003D1D40C9
MRVSINPAKKPSRGRPRIDSEAVNIRVERSLLDLLDAWIADQKDAPSRPEAIRRLLRAKLSVES